MKKSLLVMAIAAVVALLPAGAFADSFTLNKDFCTNSCLNGGTGGTVTLINGTHNSISGVTVTVDLTTGTVSGLSFHDQGLDSFVFNSSVAFTSSAVTILNAGGGSWTFLSPSNNSDGAGNPNNFGYGFDCAAGSGSCTGSPHVLSFFINGVTAANLETLAGVGGNTKVDFAANVANGSCTGMIGGGNGTSQSTASTAGTTGACGSTTTPEPASLALLGAGVLGLGGLIRRRK